MPKVSVVIPAYNAMTYLPETVESVLRQTFTDFEVLIIDDGSSDPVKQWTAQVVDPRVKLISQENQGLSGARNTGIAHAQGEYIAFLDADDLWKPTKLEKQVHCLDNNQTVGLVHTWMLLVNEQGKSTGNVMKSSLVGNVWEQLVEKNTIACPSVIVRRCCFEQVGVFDQDLRSVEDWNMWIRIATRYQFALIEEPLVCYRQLSNSMSKNCQIMEQSFHTVIERAFEQATSELLYIKNRSYSHANLCLAWKALQSENRDYKLGLHFRRQAVSYYPQICYSREYIRLSFAISLMRYFGGTGYNTLLSLTYALRRIISGVSY